MQRKKKLILFSASIVLFALIFTSGAIFGYSQRPAIEKVKDLINKEAAKPPTVDFSPFWKAWNIVDEKYVEIKEVDNQKRVWGAIEGMVNALGDPYSSFFPPKEAKMFSEDISGQFGGVGMQIGVRKGILTVIAPLKGTPAFKAGLKPGDKIIKINDEPSADMSADKAASLIRGPVGTKVRLTILRGDDSEEPFEVEITRDIIKIPTIDTKIERGKVFVISLYNFNANSANDFRKALREFIFAGTNKLILDLRGNPGGYLSAAVDMASWFLPVGKIVARERFADGKEILHRSKGYDIFNKNLKMAVLMDSGSASASEILAGALRDHGIAFLVGEKTFGKGSVQEVINITPETFLKITIAKWLTPSGKSIDGEGLEPDYEVKITEKDIDSGKDPQLEKAIELLNKK